MKIGAGGLQSMLTYDAVAARKVDPAQARLTQVEEQSLLGRQVMALEELIRMVEHLNRLAEMSNYPYRFQVRDRDDERREDGKKEKERGHRRKRQLQVALIDGDGHHRRYLSEDELILARNFLGAGEEQSTLPSGLGLNTEV